MKLLLNSVGRIQIKYPLRNFAIATSQNITKAEITELINHTILEINWFYLITLMELCLHGKSIQSFFETNFVNQKQILATY